MVRVVHGMDYRYPQDPQDPHTYLSGPAKVDREGVLSFISPAEGQLRNLYLATGWDDPSTHGVHATTDAYPFHCACWRILEAANCSPTENIPVQSLYYLCFSFPNYEGDFDFGHDYGGLHYRPQVSFDPGEEHFPDKTDYLCLGNHLFARDGGPPNRDILASHRHDPFDAVITSLLTQHHDQSAPQDPLVFPTLNLSAVDCFTKFPVEIVQFIFLYLDSPDILNFKLSSRSIADVPLHDRFWHSRFCSGGEFEYMFEFAHHPTYHGQYKAIYMSCRRHLRHPVLVNRQRIWDLAIDLHDLLSRTGTCHGTTFVPACCRSLFKRFLTLPEILSSISVSIVDVYSAQYISGIRIRDVNGNHQDLGYFHTDSSVSFTTERIVAFELAIGHRGIRGMKILSDHGDASPWIGEYRDIPRRNLRFSEIVGKDKIAIQYLKAEFDACKIVSLGIADLEGFTKALNSPDHMLPLQDTALWFPQVPSSQFTLLGPSVEAQTGVSSDWYLSMFPFQAAIFSDPEGSHLSHVTGFRLWQAEQEEVDCLSLQVRLDKPLHGQTTICVGPSDEDPDHWQSQQDFDISAADGERIIGFDVHYDSEELHGFDDEFRILWHTADHCNCRDLTTVRLWPETGQIMGFYGIATQRFGMLDIGIVCSGNATLRQFQRGFANIKSDLDTRLQRLVSNE
ncbi:hypothetical protein F5Y16DRAFT_403916 [Xylariaceae sp. FL0255]|nr:hypothetical protein F5Y16DRAFT_403916 [Xylariaceae sp. FL0255]